MKIAKILSVFLFSLMALTFVFAKDSYAAVKKTTAKSVNWNRSMIKWMGVTGAHHYNIYFREGNQTKYIGSVRDIPAMPGWNMQWINHLRSGVKYFYRIAAAHSNGVEFSWSTEKMMTLSPMSKSTTGWEMPMETQSSNW